MINPLLAKMITNEKRYEFGYLYTYDDVVWYFMITCPEKYGIVKPAIWDKIEKIYVSLEIPYFIKTYDFTAVRKICYYMNLEFEDYNDLVIKYCIVK
jgi:hypothetical protein